MHCLDQFEEESESFLLFPHRDSLFKDILSFMDLWCPSFFEEESSSGIRPEWQCDFYSSYGIDMIEENALNEKYCVQVLRILIAKADTEIDELEKDLVLLQSELVWDEHEEWHDICCNALRAKINWLDISVRKLRNKDEHEIEVFLLMHTEPAEKLHDILKAQLKSFLNEKNEQNEQSQDVVLHSRPGSPEQSAALDKNQKSSSSDSCVIVKEEGNGPNVTPKETFTSSNPSMELEVNNGNSSETLTNADVNNLMLHSLLPADGQFDEKSVVTILNFETTEKLKESDCAIKDKNAIQHFSSKSAQKRTNKQNRTKDVTAQCVNNSDLDASKHSVGHLNKKKKLSTSSLKLVSGEATMHTSVSAKHMLILDSSSNSMGIPACLSKKVKDGLNENICAEDLGSITYKQTAGHSAEMKTMCTHDLEVDGCEMQRRYTTTIGKSNLSTSCLNPEHEGNIQKADKVECLNCDMEQKLCDFAVRYARKQGVKEFKVASTDKNQHLKSLSKGEEKKKDSLQVLTRKEAALRDDEHSTLTSLVELKDENGEDKIVECMEGKPHIEEVQMSETVATDGKHVTNLYMTLHREEVKTNMESTATNVEEPDSHSKENVSNSSSSPKGKRTRKNANNRTLSYSLTGQIIKKTVERSQCEAEEPIMRPVSSQNTSLPQKKCKKLSGVPIVVEFSASSVQTNISKLHEDLIRIGEVKTDFTESEASVNDSDIKGTSPLPFDASALMKMKMRELKAIAKSQKLKKYSTMKKDDLVKQLGNQLNC